jgi:hypothetical protein
MVKKKINHNPVPSVREFFANWRKENPVEADIRDLIDAAKSYADSKAVYVGGTSDDPEDIPVRFDDNLTELEMTIRRAEKAIMLMMEVSQARKAAGLKKKGRGKEKYLDPRTMEISNPQVDVVNKLCRGEITRTEAEIQIRKIIDPRERVDDRTFKNYVNELIDHCGWFSDSNEKSWNIPIE